MATNSETGLFPALEKILQAATTPLDCNQLYDMPAIKTHAASVSRVSDYLGGLWRKGLVERLPAAKYSDGRSRWLYRWRVGRTPSPDGIVYAPRVLADRPTMLVTDEGSVLTIELPNLLISIRQKPAGFSYLEGLKTS